MDNVIKFDYENHNPELELNEFETGITPEDALKRSHNGMAIRKENETIEWKKDAEIYDPAELIALNFVEGNKVGIIVEEAKKLHLVATPEIANIPKVCWESSNPFIASVNQDGVVYGKANGTVNITATDVEDNNTNISIEVTVTGEQALVETRLIVKYNVVDSSTPTMIYSYEEGMAYGVDIYDKIEIDGEEVSVASIDANGGTYQLNAGEHVVAYTLKDPTFIGMIMDGDITKVGAVFYDCSSITSVEIPNSVMSIGNDAFAVCSSLTSVTIPNSVASIGELAFAGCISLTSVKVESGNTVYDSRNNCNAIIETATNTLIAGCKNTVIPNSVTSIGQYAFTGCIMTSITIPNSVMSIGEKAFGGCRSLSSVTIGNGVTSIGDTAFINCSGLTSVTIGNSVTSIGNDAFEGCIGLTSVTIPNSVTSIGNDAFSRCSGLTSVTIGNSVTSIGNDAFGYCSSLSSITSLAATAPTIESNTFYNVASNGTLYVPSGSSGYDVWMQNANYYLGLYGWTKVESSPTPQHDYVEIGGIKWATMNVGATSETDTGLYFQWGDTQGYTADQVGSGAGQKAFTWADYKWTEDGGETFTKYNATTVLDIEDDAVRANWGGQWRMPTTSELQALGNAVNTAWTTDYQDSGVAGLICTDKQDSSKVLFFPAAGFADSGSVSLVGDEGDVWSSSRNSDNAGYAQSFGFGNGGSSWSSSNGRYYGFSVRGVLG